MSKEIRDMLSEDFHGALRWRSNGQVPFFDTLGELWEEDLITWKEFVRSNDARAEDYTCTLSE